MSQNDANEIRSTAELLISNTRTMPYRGVGGSGQFPLGYDMSRAHSINLITEEFLGGYMQDGRMSVVRRFFCLFVTFDLFFVSLLWLICIVINGDNIFQAFQKQIVQYTIATSLFDVVAASICRFLILIVFYALLYINHWFIIAFSTSGSCLFLISKVFVYDWVDSRQQVFEVILIITSFVLSWGEAWFLDCRVIPQERHARSYFSAITSSDRSPLLAPFLSSHNERRPPESVANFYSPLDSIHNSDDEEEENEEYHQMGLDCVRKAYVLFESSDWKLEKLTGKGDTIRSTHREKMGKIYRLTARIKYPAKALLDELFYKVEGVPKWNPMVLESKIVRKINSYTDITYQASVGGGGGMVKSRDFINLRCWRLFRNGKMIDNDDEIDSDDENSASDGGTGSVTTVSDGESTTPQPSSVESGRAKFSTSSSARLPSNDGATGRAAKTPYHTLSKSLGAKDFNAAIAHINFNEEEPPPLDEDQFEDASDNLDEQEKERMQAVAVTATATTAAAVKDKVWINAAISVDYARVPPTNKYIRGENLVAGFALREIAGKSDACIFDWILCLDLKGYIPRYVLETAYTTFMSDYMKHLRNYVTEMRAKRKRVPKNLNN